MIELKIGRKTHKIAEGDVFIDNGSRVLLNAENHYHPERINLKKLSKRAIKEIGKFERVYISEYIFTLKGV